MLTLPVPLAELFFVSTVGDFVGLLAKSGAYWRINAVTLVEEGMLCLRRKVQEQIPTN